MKVSGSFANAQCRMPDRGRVFKKVVASISSVVINYHMSYRFTRTSMALDGGTLAALEWLAKKWAVSKAEVMRRAVSRAKKEAEIEDSRPTPLEALDWLHKGGGLKAREAEGFRKEVRAERDARQYWWEA